MIAIDSSAIHGVRFYRNLNPCFKMKQGMNEQSDSRTFAN